MANAVNLLDDILIVDIQVNKLYIFILNIRQKHNMPCLYREYRFDKNNTTTLCHGHRRAEEDIETTLVVDTLYTRNKAMKMTSLVEKTIWRHCHSDQ